MTREEREKKIRFITLEQAKEIILDSHSMLDRAGVQEDVGGETCQDNGCYSHLTHRIHLLAEKVKEKTS